MKNSKQLWYMHWFKINKVITKITFIVFSWACSSCDAQCHPARALHSGCPKTKAQAYHVFFVCVHSGFIQILAAGGVGGGVTSVVRLENARACNSIDLDKVIERNVNIQRNQLLNVPVHRVTSQTSHITSHLPRLLPLRISR